MSKNGLMQLAGRLGALSVALVAGFLLAGCHSGPDPRFTDLSEIGGTTGAANHDPAPGDTERTDVDLLQPGDALTITYSDLPYLQPPFEDRIKQDGTIRLIQDQTFHAAGKTRGDLEKEIRETYVPKFFKTMTVTVKLTENMRFYYVGGEVKEPGRMVYLSRMTVLKAIQSAKDFTDFAQKKKVVLTRANGKSYTINCVKAQKDPKLDMNVYPDDKIWVPRRRF